MLSCNCLNVVIESETNEFQQVTTDSLNLNEEEKQDAFFKQDIKQVVKLNKINKEHSGLVISKIVGNWILHKCLNCDVHTHAIHRDKGSSYVLVSSNLLATPSIMSLRNNENYSNIFNVVIPLHKGDGVEKHPENLPADVQLALGGLKQRTTEVLNREVAAVEERVKQFTELQYAALDTFREKAHKEHKSLARIILEKRYQPLSVPSNYSSMSSSPNIRLSNESLVTLTSNSPKDKPKTKLVTKIKNNSNRSAMRQKTTTPLACQNIDSEELFQFEESDGVQPSSASEREDSDHEEIMRSEPTQISRTKSNSLSIAKSLPMNIPVFMSQHRSRDTDDEHEDFVDEHPSDIAASIKALAKSVHGDTVFGDLPRPRFSTQI